MARATRAIVNHTSIGEYRLRFLHWEDFSCLCNDYPIKTRHHILYECRRFNKYWILRRDSIGHFILFLEFNCRAFSFEVAQREFECPKYLSQVLLLEYKGSKELLSSSHSSRNWCPFKSEA